MNSSYYKGRESVWKDLYKEVCDLAGKQDEGLKILRTKVFQEKEDRAMIANQSNLIDDLEKKVSGLESKITTRDKLLIEISQEIMTINNLSAEERMSYLRNKYKHIFDMLNKKP